MLKRLVILAVISVAQHPIPADGGQQQEHTQADPSAARPKAPAPPLKDTPKDVGDGKKVTQKESKAEKYLEDAFAPANLSNWILAGLGAVGGVVAGITLRVIFKQTKILEDSVAAAQKSADAAEKSAITAMGVAVPTLMLHKFELLPHKGHFWYDSFSHPEVIIQVKNFGQSPAILRAYMLSFCWEDELPEDPFFRAPFPCNAEDVVDPGEIFQLAPGPASADQAIPLQIAYDIEARRKMLTIYGYVSYGDIFGSPIRYMKFSKRLVEFATDGSYAKTIDYGGHKYTGQH